jgi:hypothetical protein
MNNLTSIQNVLFLDGRKYAEEIRMKTDTDRTWWEKIYLWFHDNFEMIMIAGGCIILALLLINFLGENGDCSIKSKTGKNQHGGDTKVESHDSSASSSSNSSNSTGKPAANTGKPAANTGKPATNTGKPADTTKPEENKAPVFVPKTDAQLKSDATIAAAKKKAEQILAGTAAPDKTTNQKLRSKFLTNKAEANLAKAKESIKDMPGKAFSKVAGKSVAAWQSVKSGEALEKGKEKFEDALSNAGDFAKKNAKAGYALAFTTFMVIGFGLFFVPTLIMFVIGALTLMIFNKQKIQFFEAI